MPAWGPVGRGIDPLDSTAEKEVTILLVEHDMGAVFRLADRITVLVYGQAIASGTPDEIRADPTVREAYLGDEVKRMLEVDQIETFYGKSQALFGVSLTVREGEVVTLLGRNGMGKSTTVRSIMGLTPIRSGRIVFDGTAIGRLPGYAIARLGIGLVPEGRQIFPNLTVRENMVATAANRLNAQSPYTLDDVLSIFPRLADRLDHYGNQLSGGEQQMLAVARALMTNPNLLILDEATEGLAPLIRKEIWQALAMLKTNGHAILVIDKNLDALMKLADRHCIMENGQVVWRGGTAELADGETLKARYLGV
jgi:branched-chain amino acid transport system ATP-binding protein